MSYEIIDDAKGRKLFKKRGPFCILSEIFTQARPQQWMPIKLGGRLFVNAKIVPHWLITNCKGEKKRYL